MRRAFGPPAIVLALALLALAAGPARAGKAVDGVVNLNTAPPEVLGLLPGIGPAKAVEIAAYRKRRPFRTVDELVRIKGIGRKMVRRLRSHLAIAGPTTARAVTGAPTPAAPPPVPEPRRPLAVAHPTCPKPAVPPGHGPRRPAPERRPGHAACLPPR
jgi:competence protein ComEA